MRTSLVLAAALLAAASSSAMALVNPFTEDFTAGASGWTTFNNAAPLTVSLTGGPDNSSFVSGAFNFSGQAAGATPVIIRGQEGASGDAFAGDWITGGVTQLSVFVRHDAGVPLTFFARPSASPAPGAVAIAFAPVPSGVWTLLTFAISPDSPQFVSFENGDYNSIFSNIGRLQFGVSVPASLAGVDQNFTFDVDKVMIVPAPGCVAVAGVGGLGLVSLRRRR